VRKTLVGAGLALGLGVTAIGGLAGPASAATTCVSNCTITFAPGAASTWTVPSNVLDVKVTVAAGAGGLNEFGVEPTIAQRAALKATTSQADTATPAATAAPTPTDTSTASPTPTVTPTPTTTGGAGGKVTADLGTTQAGQTLHILAGAMGKPSETEGQAAPGGGGSYVATTGHLLIAAGGGGGQGDYFLITEDANQNETGVNGTQQGGAGGFATASPNGATGVDVSTLTNPGTGATGATPGHATTTANTQAAGGTGTLTTIAGDGTITAGTGGTAGEFANYPVASGGGGYAGGGGGSAATNGTATTFAEDAAPGGGGSGYLAPGLTAAAVGPNVGDGFVTITYSLRPTITATSSTVVSGSTGTTTVSGLPANQAFSLRLTGTSTTVYTGTASADGTATVTFTIPKNTPAGSYQLDVIVDGITEAVSTPITVTTPAATTVTTAATGTPELAFTGSTLPWWLLPSALLSIASGITLTRLRRRA
jgi:hypothetical protein